MSKKNKLLLIIVCINLIITILLITQNAIITKNIRNITNTYMRDENEVL